MAEVVVITEIAVRDRRRQEQQDHHYDCVYVDKQHQARLAGEKVDQPHHDECESAVFKMNIQRVM